MILPVSGFSTTSAPTSRARPARLSDTSDTTTRPYTAGLERLDHTLADESSPDDYNLRPDVRICQTHGMHRHRQRLNHGTGHVAELLG